VTPAERLAMIRAGHRRWRARECQVARAMRFAEVVRRIETPDDDPVPHSVDPLQGVCEPSVAERPRLYVVRGTA
jgi:hypothetical protein